MVSGDGASTERIINLFNEGNRLHTVLLIATDSAKDVLSRVAGRGIDILLVTADDWEPRKEEIKAALREHSVNMIVVDHFELPVDEGLIEAGGSKIVAVTTSDYAPKEVVSALEAELRDPQKENEDIIETPEASPSSEQEWAEALKINFRPPKVAATPPPLPENNPGEASPNPYSSVPPQISGPQFTNPTPLNQSGNQSEPMPPTYLVLSILCTLLCCLVTGIGAVVYSAQVSSKYYAGDIEGAKRASRRAEIWIIVSVVLGIVVSTLYFPLMLIGI